MRKAGCVLARILLATHFFMRSTTGLVCRMKAPSHDVVLSSTPLLSRRSALLAAGCSFLASPTLALDRAEPASAAPPGQALGASKMPMPGLSEAQSSSYGKARMTYPDFKACESGLQVKDVKEGVGDPARVGDRVRTGAPDAVSTYTYAFERRVLAQRVSDSLHIRFCEAVEVQIYMVPKH